jgi:hypothetical protein
MAILLTARKARETDSEVEYEFGTGEVFDHTLTIDKSTGDVSASHGQLDSSAGMLSVKIKKIFQQRGEYPSSAVYAA